MRNSWSLFEIPQIFHSNNHTKNVGSILRNKILSSLGILSGDKANTEVHRTISMCCQKRIEKVHFYESKIYRRAGLRQRPQSMEPAQNWDFLLFMAVSDKRNTFFHKKK